VLPGIHAPAGARISRAEFEANLSAKLFDPIFTQDLNPLLTPGVDWNLEEASSQIHEAWFAFWTRTASRTASSFPLSSRV
jgi:hypothetical protein